MVEQGAAVAHLNRFTPGLSSQEVGDVLDDIAAGNVDHAIRSRNISCLYIYAPITGIFPAFFIVWCVHARILDQWKLRASWSL
jgi:hypothetical protein